MSAALFSGAGPLIVFILKATLVLIAALGATFLLRRGTAGERHLVWLAALVGVLALPILSRIPTLHLAILPSGLASSSAPPATPGEAADAPTTIIISNDAEGVAAPVARSTIVTSAAGGITIVRRGVATPVIAAAAPVAAAASVAAAAPVAAVAVAPTSLTFAPDALPAIPGSLLQTLAILWAGVALSFLGWLAFGALQVRRIVATATELTSPDWTMPLCEVADRLDLEQPPRLVVSDRIEMAFACRALAPTIVLPAASENWNDDRRRAVLFHELSHVKRHDLVSHLLGRVACALYWFHPLVWTAARNLRNESEKACDDLVLSCGARASDYAQHLLDMVTSVRHHGAPALGIPMARKKEFEGRMLAILDPAIRRASPGHVRAAAVIAVLSTLSLTIAAVSPAPASSRASAEDPSRAAAVEGGVIGAESQGFAVAAPAAVATNSSAESASASNAVAPEATRSITIDSDRLGHALGLIANSAVKGTLEGLGFAFQGRAPAADSGRIALLIKVLQTDTDAGVRRAAAWGLAEAGTAAARAALVRALESDVDDQVREMAAWALGEDGARDAAAPLARALTHDANARVRQTSAWALGQAGRRADADALVSGVADADPQVRETSIWALGEIGLDRAPASLVNALADTSPSVREITAWTLGQIGDTTAVRPLTRAFQNEADAKVKRMYLWSLSEIGSAPTELIESAMKSSDPEMRRHAVALLTGGGGAWPMPMPRPMPRPNP